MPGEEFFERRFVVRCQDANHEMRANEVVEKPVFHTSDGA